MTDKQNQLKREITGSPYEAGSFSDRVQSILKVRILTNWNKI